MLVDASLWVKLECQKVKKDPLPLTKHALFTLKKELY